MKHLPGLKLTLLSVLAVFVVSGGGLATVAAWQTDLTVGNVTITSGEGWGNIYELPQVVAGDFDTFALKDNGDFWAWGENDKGQLGDGTTNSSLAPVKVADGHKFVQISTSYNYTLAIDTDGYAWAWGGNDDGKLGNGTTTGSTTPVQVSGGHKFRQITTDYNRAVALDTNGNIWAWGRNDYGQLGNGTTTNRVPRFKSKVIANLEKSRQVSIIRLLWIPVAIFGRGAVTRTVSSATGQAGQAPKVVSP